MEGCSGSWCWTTALLWGDSRLQADAHGDVRTRSVCVRGNHSRLFRDKGAAKTQGNPQRSGVPVRSRSYRVKSVINPTHCNEHQELADILECPINSRPTHAKSPSLPSTLSSASSTPSSPIPATSPQSLESPIPLTELGRSVVTAYLKTFNCFSPETLERVIENAQNYVNAQTPPSPSVKPQ